MFALHCIHEILYTESLDTGLISNYSCKNFLLLSNAYPQ